jgi:RNA polymerase sigma-70 factor (ECF subfamily)
MFGWIAKLRRRPASEWLVISQIPARHGGRSPNPEGRDWAALTLLLQRHREAVVHFLYRMVQDQAVAEELAVEVFMRSYRSNGEENGPAAQPATRLFRMAIDLALNEPQIESRQPPPPPMPDVSENAGHAMACMPGKQRAAVLMHKYHRMDSWQIARVLDCPEPMARSLLLSAYDRLRDWMAPCGTPQSWDCTAQ